MSNFFSSSIGKKVIMSVTGLFLILFLLVHLSANLTLFAGAEIYNEVTHFMETNLLIQIMQPVLALGFIIHIIYASTLTLQNQKARPVRYERVDQSDSSAWTSRNMYILGGLVLVFIALHLLHFLVPMKFGDLSKVQINGQVVDNPYNLVTWHFKIWYYAAIYILGAIFLALHLTHGFWSAFQTIGWNNKVWRRRFTVLGYIFAAVFGIGYAIIPLYFLLAA